MARSILETCTRLLDSVGEEWPWCFGAKITMTPTLLYLHGVGKGDRDENWKVALSEGLESVGYPDLADVPTLSPRYAFLLKGTDPDHPIPSNTVPNFTGERGRQYKRDFERRVGALEAALGAHDRGVGVPFADLGTFAIAQVPQMVQAKNYVTNRSIRAHVMRRIIGALPEEGPIVIVGHSLGSVITADIIRRIPKQLDVRGVVTIGSPLAAPTFQFDSLKSTLKNPPTNVDWWINFWNDMDPVTGRRGISSVFPWLVDRRIHTSNPASAHGSRKYLKDPSVARAIGYALFGSQSQAMVKVSTGLDIRANRDENQILLQLRYAHLIKRRLKGETLDRFKGALREVQADLVDTMMEARKEQSLSIPSVVAAAAVDMTHADSQAIEPAALQPLHKDEALIPLISLATESLISPYEIDVDESLRLDAFKELTVEMGLGAQIAHDVFGAIEEARKALAKNRGNLLKWGALGVGTVAILATGGLALAAMPAGLAGAAAVTSGLAAFGPGGLIGGLMTAGTLVSVSSGGLAVGLASSGASAQTVEEVLATGLTAAALRKKQGRDPDPRIWLFFVETEEEVRRNLSLLSAFSDPSSGSIQELKRKLKSVQRALEFMQSEGIGGVPEESVEPTDSMTDSPESVG